MRHNIVGSEAFQKSGAYHVAELKPGGFRKRRARMVMAFVGGALAAVILGGGAVAVVFASGAGLI
ncbi:MULTISPECIES: hypothetical protein [Brevundimonas]|uniref:hypothetical protein n=1 Tax=Brevundimonas TaxID=41275 RepID=UPI000F035B40|nr:hypothetical protein [Brevundimonas lutea]